MFRVYFTYMYLGSDKKNQYETTFIEVKSLVDEMNTTEKDFETHFSLKLRARLIKSGIPPLRIWFINVEWQN